MKPEQLYQHLKELAEKLNITVREQNLRNTPGIKVKSGFCTVKGDKRVIMDKHIPVHEKNEILAEYLSQMPHEDVYVMPAVREAIRRFSKD